jgi:hypothetical protein
VVCLFAVGTFATSETVEPAPIRPAIQMAVPVAIAQSAPKPRVPGRPGTPYTGTVAEVIVQFPSLGWYLRAKPDGSAIIQYASVGDDVASLPAGTLDFGNIVAEVKRQQTEQGFDPSATCAGLEEEGQANVSSAKLKDDAYFRQLIASVSDSWDEKGRGFDQQCKDDPICPPTVQQ